MAPKVSADELRLSLREALAVQLAPEGWVLLDEEGSGIGAVAELIRAVDDEFAATAEVLSAAVDDRVPIRIDSVEVGIAYEPLRPLWPLLGRALRFDVLSYDVHRDLDEDGNDRVDELDDTDDWVLEIANVEQVPRAAEDLAAPILAHGVRRARRLASVDAILAELGDDEDPSFIDWRAPALLAAAGRVEEARDALDRFEAGTESAYTRQLRRWIDSGGDPSLIPAEGEPAPGPLPAPKSLREASREARGQREAIETVRRAGSELDRDAQRELLERELGSRDVVKSPLWIEHTLDHLDDTPAQQRRAAMRSLADLASTGKAVFDLIRDAPAPQVSPPDWVRPPARAGYAVPRDRPARWTRVDADPAASHRLDQIYTAVPRVGDTVKITAWLDHTEDEPPKLAVFIGPHQVGTLNTRDSHAYQPAMLAAAQRDEVPHTTARLTPRPDPAAYLIELQLPAPTPPS